VYCKSAVILLALARGSPKIVASVLALAGTICDRRVTGRSILKISSNPLGRTLRRLGAQIVVLAFILFDIGGFGFTLVEPLWLAPWITINMTALGVALRWSEDSRTRRESTTAMEQQFGKLEGPKHDALKRQQAEQAERLRKAEQQLREAEERRRREEAAHDALKRDQAEQAERLRKAEQQLQEAEERRRQEEAEREVLRQKQMEQAERLRKAEQQLREAEQRRRQEEDKTQRKRQRERTHADTQFQMDWWIVLGVAPSAGKGEIARNYRKRIKQYHPDRVQGLAPEFLQLAEERTKALNEAYANAIRR